MATPWRVALAGRLSRSDPDVLMPRPLGGRSFPRSAIRALFLGDDGVHGAAPPWRFGRATVFCLLPQARPVERPCSREAPSMQSIPRHVAWPRRWLAGPQTCCRRVLRDRCAVPVPAVPATASPTASAGPHVSFRWPLRYTLVELVPEPAQRDLVRQAVEVVIPMLDASVGDAMRHVLLRSGYRFCGIRPGRRCSTRCRCLPRTCALAR